MSKNDGHQQHIPSYLIENPLTLIHSTSQYRYHFQQNIQAPHIATHQKNKMITAWNVKSNQTKSSIPKCHESSYIKCHESSYIKAHGPPPQAKCSIILAHMHYNDAKKNIYTQTRVFVPQYAVPNKTFLKTVPNKTFMNMQKTFYVHSIKTTPCRAIFNTSCLASCDQTCLVASCLSMPVCNILQCACGRCHSKTHINWNSAKQIAVDVQAASSTEAVAFLRAWLNCKCFTLLSKRRPRTVIKHQT